MFYDGDLNKATELFYKIDELQLNIQNFSNFLEYCKLQKTAEILNFIDTNLGKDKTAQIEFLQYILHTIRHNILQNSVSEHSLNAGLRNVPNIVKLNLTILQARALYKLLNEAIIHIERNVNSRIVFMDLAIQLRKVIAN